MVCPPPPMSLADIGYTALETHGGANFQVKIKSAQINNRGL